MNGAAVLARYDGLCPVCRTKFRAFTDYIVKTNDEAKGRRWRHASCNDKAAAESQEIVLELGPAPVPVPAPVQAAVEVVQNVVRLDDDSFVQVKQQLGLLVEGMENKLGTKLGKEMNAVLNEAVAVIKKAIDEKPAKVVIAKRADCEVRLEGELLAKEVDELLFWINLREDIFLVGPTGCGKTYAIPQLAKILGCEYGMISCTAGMSESQITGRLVPVGDGGKFEFVTTQFIERFENGGIFLFDEVDAADPNVLLVINSALSNGELWLPNRHEKPKAVRHPDFVCIFGANTFGRGADRMFVGRNQLDAATLNRFATVEMDYSETVEKALCPDPILYGTLLAWRARIREHKIRQSLSTRQMARMYKAWRAGKDLEAIKGQITAGWSKDEIAKVIH